MHTRGEGVGLGWGWSYPEAPSQHIQIQIFLLGVIFPHLKKVSYRKVFVKLSDYVLYNIV